MRRFGGGIFTERASTVGIDCHWWIRASRESGEKRLVGSRGYNRRPPSRRRTRRRAHHSRPKAAQTSNCLIRTPFLRHLSRRVVRVEIGQKPGVVRGTGSSNPSPSSGESGTNRAAPGNSVRGACRNQAATQPALGRRSVADGGSDRWGMAQFRLRSCALRHRSCEC